MARQSRKPDQHLASRCAQPIFSATLLSVAAALFCLLFSLTLFSPSTSHAQARVDLDDLAVKGEIINDNRLRMSTRQSTSIQDRVKYRTNFRSEIVDGVDVRVPASETIDQGIDRASEESEAK